jgi:hypothetical protein
MKASHSQFIGDCRNEELIEEIFGSTSEFARQVEENGDNFQINNFLVKYNKKTDIHSFFKTEEESKSYFCRDCGCVMLLCPHKK